MSDPASFGPGSGSGGNIHEYTVSELSNTLKRAVEEGFGHVRVRGELSGVKRAASGHVYMGLKDDQAVMDAVMWRGTAQRMSFAAEDGLEVICTGKLTTYPARSKYQLVVEHMEPAGAGALMALLEERKKKLAAEGLFDPARRKAIPFLPRVIGVVTSPTGAVIRDILHRLADRFPSHVLVWPVPVQGEGAADQIAAAIRGFNAMPEDGRIPRPDVLIVARGGGSIEDLWSFNEEQVVRAAAESDIPLISAVGHETDTTLIDYAADMRAPTPTGAAEMAVPVREELLASVADYSRRMAGLRTRLTDDRRAELAALGRALPRPRDILALPAQKLDDMAERLPRALRAITIVARGRWDSVCRALAPMRLKDLQNRAQERLSAAGRMLESLSFERILDRGFVLVEDAKGKPVLRRGETSPDMLLKLRFADGSVRAKTLADESGAPSWRRKPAKSKPPARDDDQGSLF